MSTICDMTNPRLAEIANSFPFRDWMQVLARPHLFQMLTRQPSREHLLMLCDAYLPYARSRRELAKEQGCGEPVRLNLTSPFKVTDLAWRSSLGSLPKESRASDKPVNVRRTSRDPAEKAEFNAKAQRRKGARKKRSEEDQPHFFAFLRLCVFASLR